MTIKSFIVLAFWVAAVAIFLLVGLDILDEGDLADTQVGDVALGLAAAWMGMIVHVFMPPSGA